MNCATSCSSASAASTTRTQSCPAPGRGRRTRRWLRAPPRVAETSRARPARVAAPGGGARRSRRRAVDEQLPLPPRAARRSHLRDGPARRARGAPCAASPTSSRVAERRSGGAGIPLGGGRSQQQTRSLASVEAAREAQAVFGLAEALGHLEHALELWDAVPDASELVQIDLAELCMWAAELASQTGAAPRARGARAASDRAGRDRRCSAVGTPARAGSAATSTRAAATEAALRTFERAVELVPAEPPSAERAQALAALGEGLMLAWRIRRVAPGRGAGARARTAPSGRER